MDRMEPLSSVDRAWLRMDKPSNMMVINGVLLFDQPLDLEVVRDLITRRLVPIPRFRQRVVLGPTGRHAWEDDEAFDVSHHVQRIELPDPGDDAALQALVASKMSEPLDASRPLWIFYLVDGYRGGCALLGRLHHAIGDGIALMMVLLSITDVEPQDDPEAAARDNPLTKLFTRAEAGVAAAREYAAQIMPESMNLMISPATARGKAKKQYEYILPGSAALGRLVFRPPDPKTMLKGPLGVEKRVAWSDPIDLELVKTTKDGLGCTVNDILMTAMSGALRRYVKDRGGQVDGLNIRAAVPVNLRRLERMADLGNRFGLVFVSLPLGIADPMGRLEELGRRMSALKGSPEPVLAFGILGAMGLSPVAIQKLVMWIFGTKATAVLTNVPGPKDQLYVAGCPMSGMMFWVPQSGSLGMGISILSYAGSVRLGVTTDAGLVPDPGSIVEAFQEEFELFSRLAAERARA